VRAVCAALVSMAFALERAGLRALEQSVCAATMKLLLSGHSCWSASAFQRRNNDED
jgi:hypothetical protein